MKIYIASRFDRKQEVTELYRRFRALGHTIEVDWTVHKSIKPYEEHETEAREYSVEDARGALDCDVFILLSDESGTGMYTELGIALASALMRDAPKIFVVGPHRYRSFFFFHPLIRRCETVEEVFGQLAQ